MLNASSTAVKRLLDAPAEADIAAPLHALYVTALLLGRVPPTDAHAALLRTAVADMIEAPPDLSGSVQLLTTWTAMLGLRARRSRP